MPRESTHQDLVAWQKAMSIAEGVYRETSSWPAEERFALISQIKRAAISVPANIAEGSGRSGSAELRHHLSIAHGSLWEMKTHLDLARRLGFSSGPISDMLISESEELSRIIREFIHKLG